VDLELALKFKFAQRMKELELSSSDRPQIEKFRNASYSQIRSAISDPTAHEDYCREIEKNPVLTSVLRKFSDPGRNSDATQQPEKIRAYGDIVGMMMFCGVDVDGQKLGSSLYTIGVASENVPPVVARSKVKRNDLELERAQMKGSASACSQMEANAFVQTVRKMP
jgi:hypothetical protein